MAKFVDAQGRTVPDACPSVRFSVSGPVRIIGVGNGDPSCHDPEKGDRVRAFNGLCLAILQSAGRRGRATLAARASGLKTGHTAIKFG